MIFVYSPGILWYYIKARVHEDYQGQESCGQAGHGGSMRVTEELSWNILRQLLGNTIIQMKRRYSWEERYRFEENKLGTADTGIGGIRHRQVHRHIFWRHLFELWTVLRIELASGAGFRFHRPDLRTDHSDYHSQCHRRRNRVGSISVYQIVPGGRKQEWPFWCVGEGKGDAWTAKRKRRQKKRKRKKRNH